MSRKADVGLIILMVAASVALWGTAEAQLAWPARMCLSLHACSTIFHKLDANDRSTMSAKRGAWPLAQEAIELGSATGVIAVWI